MHACQPPLVYDIWQQPYDITIEVGGQTVYTLKGTFDRLHESLTIHAVYHNWHQCTELVAIRALHVKPPLIYDIWQQPYIYNHGGWWSDSLHTQRHLWSSLRGGRHACTNHSLHMQCTTKLMTSMHWTCSDSCTHVGPSLVYDIWQPEEVGHDCYLIFFVTSNTEKVAILAKPNGYKRS